MSKKVHLYSSLKDYTNGRNMVEVKGDTVGECLDDLVRQFPEIKPIIFDKHGRLLDQILVSLNLESAYRLQLGEPVKDGDELYIVLIIAGG